MGSIKILILLNKIGSVTTVFFFVFFIVSSISSMTSFDVFIISFSSFKFLSSFEIIEKTLYFSVLREVNGEVLLMILPFLYIFNIHCLFNKSSLENSVFSKSPLILGNDKFLSDNFIVTLLLSEGVEFLELNLWVINLEFLTFENLVLVLFIFMFCDICWAVLIIAFK